MAWFGVDDDTAKVLGTGFGALLAGLFGRSYFKRRWSADEVIAASDEAKRDLLTSVIAERKEWHSREAELLARIDKILTDLQSSRGEVEVLHEQLSALRAEIRTTKP